MRTCRVAWVKEEPFGVEFAEVRLSPDQLRATGVAIGGEPVPYRLDYILATRRGFVTSRLRVTAQGDGWERRLDMRRTSSGVWTMEVDEKGDASLSPPGGDVSLLADALDCDLGLSPSTNTMPVLRHGLLHGGGPVDLQIAWVSVPDLAVQASNQRYTFLRSGWGQRIIRFDEVDSGFTADLTFDEDGLVLHYPELARRLA